MLVDWVRFEIEGRPWEPFKDVLRPLRSFSRKELRKLRVTRVVAARITSKLLLSCDLLNVFGVFLSVKLVARFSPNALRGAATKSRRLVEYFSDDVDNDLGSVVRIWMMTWTQG